MFYIFYPTASATAYGQRLKFFMAEHLAKAEGENCAFGPTLDWYSKSNFVKNALIWGYL